MNSNEPSRLEASQCQVCETENSAVGWVRGSITGKKRHTHTRTHSTHTCTRANTPLMDSSLKVPREATWSHARPVSEQADVNM